MNNSDIDQQDEEFDEVLQNCIASCFECYGVCTTTKIFCLEEGGDHANVDHIGLLDDCAKICSFTADFIIRGSNFHMDLCKVCIDICNACADDCEKMIEHEGKDSEIDKQMQTCVEACRKCSESCEIMTRP